MNKKEQVQMNREVLERLNTIAKEYECEVSRVYGVRSVNKHRFEYLSFNEEEFEFYITTFSSHYTTEELEEEIENLQKAKTLAEKLNKQLIKELELVAN